MTSPGLQIIKKDNQQNDTFFFHSIAWKLNLFDKSATRYFDWSLVNHWWELQLLK